MSISLNRRQLLQTGGAAGLAAAFASMSAGTANAAGPLAASGPLITDLGPAVVQFSLMSSLLVGDTVYIGSRNLNPPRVIGYHLPTGRVTSRTDLGSGYSIQALAADPSGRYLYAGVLRDGVDGKPNIYRWDLSAPGSPAVGVGETGDRDIRALAVAPDGKVYAAGGGLTTNAPSLWEYDPATNATTSWGIPDPGATIAQAVAATSNYVYFGTGSTLGGGNGSSPGRLFAFDRTTKAFTNILPSEVAAGVSVTSLSVLDGQLGVGVKGPGKSVLISLADHSKYTIIAKTGVMFRQLGNQVFFVKEPGVWSYNMATRKITQILTEDVGAMWGLDVYGSKALTVSSYDVIEIDPVAKTAVKHDLTEAGAPGGPQLCMGLAAGAGDVYVGGTGVIARHQLASDTVSYLRATGEAKDAVVVGGVLFTGQYNSRGILSYDPTTSQLPYQVAALPAGQNRPLDVCWDAINGLVIAGAQNDTGGGGCFAAYNPATAQVITKVNPIDNLQMVRAVATREGTAYLGGDNIYADGPRSTVVAWDPVANQELWRLDPGQTAGIAALAVQGKYLYGMSRRAAGLFVIDVETRQVVHRGDLSSVCTDFGALQVSRGIVYGVSDTTVFRIDPKTFAVSVVLADTKGGWYSGPHITADENGLLYTLQGSNLVRIDDQQAMQTLRKAQ
ncbi:PQQ-binding-like beta-propeller repeat protein [Paenarthrobacter sp. GOM3]|uniref:PQQ-binding-like beta-propeller repeat protein n=1 Tax=Paenarthrobacter sp. GOM3 TaxID=2782567 RepID=UPI001BA44C2A|nr:PQQ-binding-like beta-propeller repeat protein [Paenarthrobacter sp. GOM3]WOH18573.1 PQQ-binding-like beta-propeller repeat protein [Paenarthrobacter sp. GOM3]